MLDNYKYFTESEIYEIDSTDDVNFLLEFKEPESKNSLITKAGDKWKINFVGEVKTPNATYFSFPKNVYDENLSNKQEIVTDLLEILKRKDLTTTQEGKSLSINRTGNYSAERIYFEKLKSYFLDFITYEFIYPQNPKKVHSRRPIGSKISVFDTVRNKKRFGSGITYRMKDVSNSDDWMLDDIYYHTLQIMKNRLGVSFQEERELNRMCEYLKDEGYEINPMIDNLIISKSGKPILDMSDSTEVLKKIKSSDVGIIHIPIKNTLIEYYDELSKSSSTNSVNVIFTSNFEKVWERMIQKSLTCDSTSSKNFKSELEKNFSGTQIYERPTSTQEKDNYVRSGLLVNPDARELSDLNQKKWISFRNGRWWYNSEEDILLPDIFVDYDNKRFIGDAKYYKDPLNANFQKEFDTYNRCQNNQYPMVVFAIPDSGNIDTIKVPTGSEDSIGRGYRRSGENELILILVSVKKVMKDALYGSKKVLDKSLYLINKFTRKVDGFNNVKN